MALSYDTEGYSFNPQFASGGEAALGELKPLQLASSAGKLSFIAPKPPTPINAHPEAVGQAVAQSLGELGKGITAAYLSKKEKQEKALAEGRKKAPFAEGFSEDPDLGLVPKAGAVDPSVDAVAFNAKLDELKKHIDNSVGTGGRRRKGGAASGGVQGDGAIDVPADQTPEPAAAQTEQRPNPLQQLNFKLEHPLVPGGVLYNKAQGRTPSLEGLKFSPHPQATTQETQGGLASYDFNSGPKFADASSVGDLSDVGPTQEQAAAVQAAAPAPDVVGDALASIFAPVKATTGPVSQGAALAATPPVTQGQPIDQKFEQHVGKKGPVFTEAMATALRDYYEKTGRGRPDIRQYAATKTHPAKWGVEWDSARQQIAKEEKAAEGPKPITPYQESRLSDAQRKMLDTEIKQYKTDDSVKALTDPNKGKAINLVSFLQDYSNKPGGIPDMGMLDSYARMESGGKVTRDQAELALKAKSVPEKFELLFQQPVTGGILSQKQKDEMYTKYYESYNAAARMANSRVVGPARDRLLNDNGITDERKLPQFFVTDIIPRHLAANFILELGKEAATIERALRTETDPEVIAEQKLELAKLRKRATKVAQRAKYSNEQVLGEKELLDKTQGFYGGGSNFGEFNGSEH